MAMFIQTDATGAGAGNVDASLATIDLGIAVNGDTGFGVDPAVGNRQRVTYARTLTGAPPVRIETLVNTAFMPDYGQGLGPQAVDIVILPVGSNFVLNDGRSILVVGGTALPPANSNQPGSASNTTNDCLVIYDTSDNDGNGWCLARDGTGGTLDLRTPRHIILYHELSHAFRIVNDTLLALTLACNPSSPEENAAITDENDLRTQVANASGVTPELRDPGIHCGGSCGGGGSGSCCIVASVSSGSPYSAEVQLLRAFREGVLRRTEIGFAFFESLHRDYYAFSPQVSTMMATNMELRAQVYEGYVRPLILILKLLQAAAANADDDAAIGRQVIALTGSKAEAERLLTQLGIANALWSGTAGGLGDMANQLAELLETRAWPSEHVGWALIEPVSLLAELVEARLAGASNGTLGKALKVGFDSWASRMPIDHIWGVLTLDEARKQVDELDRLFQWSASARGTFLNRLRNRFEDLPSIRNLVQAYGS